MKGIIKLYYENEYIFKTTITLLVLSIIINTLVDRKKMDDGFANLEKTMEMGDSATVEKLRNLKKNVMVRLDSMEKPVSTDEDVAESESNSNEVVLNEILEKLSRLEKKETGEIPETRAEKTRKPGNLKIGIKRKQ